MDKRKVLHKTKPKTSSYHLNFFVFLPSKSSLGDLKSMREGLSKTNGATELEHVIWGENDDPKVSNFSRQVIKLDCLLILSRT